MSNYTARISWSRNGEKFTDSRYKRAHHWKFDGGVTVPASSSPHVVPMPMSDPSAVDPEEAFIASLSSCHMLLFLSIAAKRGFVVDSYQDKAEGAMEPNEAGKLAFAKVILHPKVSYGKGASPTPEEDVKMHHQAHQECFIANSVKTEIEVESSIE